ncbi:MAG: DEAD/DEAH box helicase [Planctomycetes bacterium]|nr:DEAD/DEAH box helicase [Planctomycetota bacterium]
MTVDEWQQRLRREYGRAQSFRWKNLGEHPVFSEFEVTNPETRRTYRVRIRGAARGENFCTCPDFAVNTLGACKHVEFVLGRLERGAETRRALTAEHQPEASEVFMRYGVKREIVFRAGASCPPVVRALAAGFFDDAGVLRPGAPARFEKFIEGARRAGHDLHVGDDCLKFLADARDREHRARVLDRAFPRGAADPAFDKLIRGTLAPYQRQGVLFAVRAGRALIADEMGLGKTVQAIAAAALFRREFGVERVLIVCPTSLKHQWKSEIARFLGEEALIVGSGYAARQVGFEAASFFKIVNYDVVHRAQEEIRRWAPDLVILDEAQRIKNWKTRTAGVVKRLESPYAVVLTGTPLENRLEELHSIVEFVDRHRLGPLFRFLERHQVLEDNLQRAGKVVGYRDLDAIGRTLEPVLIRRRKKEILTQLPERMEKKYFVSLTPKQRAIHGEFAEIVGRIVRKWQRFHFLSEEDRRRLMAALQSMRMVCDSTYLIDPETNDGNKIDEVITVLGEMLEEPGAKVVVFSSWLRVHELIRDRAGQKGWGHVFFHGGVPGSKRGDLIARFRDDDDCRLFLSTDAGGVGLNLQFASNVVNVDLPWNPAVLEQRVGRVHRIGQRRSVRVANFIAENSIEHGILSVLGFKTSMFVGALDGGSPDVALGGSRLQKFMETVEKTTAAIPAAPAGDAEAVALDATGGDEIESGEEPIGAAPAVASGGASMPETSPAPAAAIVAATAPVSAPASADTLMGVLSSAASLFQSLVSIAAPAYTGQRASVAPSAARLVSRDEKTGEQFIRLPLPTPDAAQKIAGALRTVAEALAAVFSAGKG